MTPVDENNKQTTAKPRRTGAHAAFLVNAQQMAQTHVAQARTTATERKQSASQQAQQKLNQAHMNAQDKLGQNLQDIVITSDNGGLLFLDAAGTLDGAIRPAGNTTGIAAKGTYNVAIDQGRRQVVWMTRLDEAARPFRTSGSSVASQVRVTVRFQNTTPVSVRIYWVDETGNDQLRYTLPPGETADLNTFATHCWRVIDEVREEELLFYTARRDATQTATIRLQSMNGQTATTIKFKNFTTMPVVLKWIDFQGVEREYARLAPRQQHIQQTYLTHPWIIRSADNNDIITLHAGKEPQPEFPIYEVPVRTITSKQAVSVQFVNQTRMTLDVYWVNHQGVESKYATLAPGQSYKQSTYVTHPWRIREQSTQAPVRLYLPSTVEQQVCNITPDGLYLTTPRSGGEIWADEVALYTHFDYQGPVWIFHSDYPDFRVLGLNDIISAIRIGSNVQVTVFEHVNYQGKQLVVQSDLQRLVGTSVANDTISSARIESFTMAVARAGIQGESPRRLFRGRIGRAPFAAPLVLDVIQQQLYWLDPAGILYRSNEDGSSLRQLLQVGKTSDEDYFNLTLDLVNRVLYWASNRRIARTRLDNMNVEIVINNLQLNEPPALVIDGTGGYLYWNDNRAIHRANLNGEGRKELYAANIPYQGLTLDEATQMLYWVEEATLLRRASSDGAGVVQTVFRLPDNVGVCFNLALLTKTGADHQRLIEAQASRRSAQSQATQEVQAAHERATDIHANATTNYQQKTTTAAQQIESGRQTADRRRTEAQNYHTKQQLAAQRKRQDANNQVDQMRQTARNQADVIQRNAQADADALKQRAQEKLDDARRQQSNQ